MDYYYRFRSDFCAQKLPGVYKTKLTIKMCSFFVILGIANISLGVVSYIPFRGISRVVIPYSREIGTDYAFEIKNLFRAPVFLYLEMSDFYQSFFKYSRGFSSDQLKGQATSSIYDCYPLKYSDGKIIYPCGLIANSYVFDRYKLFDVVDGKEILISEEDIAWSSAIDRIRSSEYADGSVVAPILWPSYSRVPDLNGDERFANWMLAASFPSFRKLFGRIDQDLMPGRYVLRIDDVTDFGSKKVLLTTNSWLGNTNYFLSAMLVISGALIIMFTLILWYFRHKYGY